MVTLTQPPSWQKFSNITQIRLQFSPTSNHPIQSHLPPKRSPIILLSARIFILFVPPSVSSQSLTNSYSLTLCQVHKDLQDLNSWLEGVEARMPHSASASATAVETPEQLTSAADTFKALQEEMAAKTEDLNALNKFGK